jgi:hypothetical protein
MSEYVPNLLPAIIQARSKELFEVLVRLAEAEEAARAAGRLATYESDAAFVADREHYGRLCEAQAASVAALAALHPDDALLRVHDAFCAARAAWCRAPSEEASEEYRVATETMVAAAEALRAEEGRDGPT